MFPTEDLLKDLFDARRQLTASIEYNNIQDRVDKLTDAVEELIDALITYTEYKKEDFMDNMSPKGSQPPG